MTFNYNIGELCKIINGTFNNMYFGIKSPIINNIKFFPFEICEGDTFISIESKRYSNVNGAIGFTGDEDSVFGLGGFNNIINDIEEAVEKGAKIVILDSLEAFDKFKNDVPIIMVDDCLVALKKIIADLLSQTNIQVIGVTGSTGKTTLSKALYDFLKDTYKTTVIDAIRTSMLSLVSHIIENVSNDDDFLIIEMQVDFPGQIKLFTDIVKLDFAFITSINRSHLQRFRSLDNIVKEKTSIYYGLKQNGFLFINTDSESLSNWNNAHNYQNVITIGKGKNADYYPSHIKQIGEFNINAFRINDSKKESFILVKSKLPGMQYIDILLFIYALSKKLELTKSAFLSGINQFSSIVGRFQIFRGKNDSTIIIDSYNASLMSMKNSILYTCSLNKRKHILILGSMLELANQTRQEHEELGRFINEIQNVDYVLSMGEAMLYTNKEITRLKAESVRHCFSYEKMMEYLSDIKIDRDTVILVKGSGGMRMEIIGLNLLKGKCF